MIIRVEAGVATVTRKLYSRKGTLLGTITYPAEWDITIRARNGITLPMHQPMNLSDYLAATDELRMLRTFYLCRHYGRTGEREGLEIGGLTPEEFEQQPHCSFAPGAGYLRSLIE